jgi:energy-coupling factor transporter ATP-binding protein EcfA2
VVLYQDNWDDFGNKCRFIATLWLSDSKSLALGGVRIAVGDQQYRVKDLPRTLNKLPDAAISLGESIAYYRKLKHGTTAKIRREYLSAMGDIVVRRSRAKPLEGTQIWRDSFMRELSSRHALDRGGYYVGGKVVEMEPPSFRFSMQLPNAIGQHVVNLDFAGSSGLPHRTMLFIGRNGTGKTRALANLAYALMPPQVFRKEIVDNPPEVELDPEPTISRVIAISYNAFDEFPLPAKPAGAPRLVGADYSSRLSYKYCGLRTPDGTINAGEISTMLDEALEPVASSEREDVLQRVLSTLLDAERAKELCDDAEERAAAVGALSAGQRLVAAIFCNIVGFIEERSVLLIDEPETNLHPGLLSSVIAAIEDVLHEFDSYAIVATHSPILLQQVPSKYVRVFTRINDVPGVLNLSVESFGEDLGELSRLALGLADPERDFTDVLARLHEDFGSAKAVEKLFDMPLGIPARAFLYGLDDEIAADADLDE